MEKQPKLKNKILRILPKAAAAVTVSFQNPPFSPGRDHKLRTENATTRWVNKPHGGKGFSGPIVSMIPDEARRKHKDGGNNVDSQEPTSPKVSCMGQIKLKKKQIKKANAKSMSLPVDTTRSIAAGSGSASTRRDRDSSESEVNKHASKFQRMFFHRSKPKKPAGRKSDSDASASAPPAKKSNNEEALLDRSAPSVGQMKRFASGRDAFANFDWKAQVAPEEIDHRDYYYSDEDRADSDAEEEEEDEEVSIPFSAPILVGGYGGGGVPNLKPRKEINLWKRRTMAPPRPLRLNPVAIAK